MDNVWISWSSGKDSAWMLHVLREQGITPRALFTTYSPTFDRVSMHSTRVALLQAQADACTLPIHLIPIPYPCPNDAYEAAMTEFIAKANADNVSHVAFGDLFLQDIRDYRDTQMKATGIGTTYPLWLTPTDALARTMVDNGLKAIISCVDPKQLPESFVGRTFDHDFLNDLPDGVDPCGENGEFHSIVIEGPMFNTSLNAHTGEIVNRDGFTYCDVILDP